MLAVRNGIIEEKDIEIDNIIEAQKETVPNLDKRKIYHKFDKILQGLSTDVNFDIEIKEVGTVNMYGDTQATASCISRTKADELKDNGYQIHKETPFLCSTGNGDIPLSEYIDLTALKKETRFRNAYEVPIRFYIVEKLPVDYILSDQKCSELGKVMIDKDELMDVLYEHKTENEGYIPFDENNNRR